MRNIVIYYLELLKKKSELKKTEEKLKKLKLLKYQSKLPETNFIPSILINTNEKFKDIEETPFKILEEELMKDVKERLNHENK